MVDSVSPGPRIRTALDDIPMYKAGQKPAPRDDLRTFKVSSNENPYPPLPHVLDVIRAASAEINRYPDPGAVDLVEAIARYHSVSPDSVAVATGAVALCYQIAASTAEAGDEVIFAWRSFEAYPIVTQVAGAKAVPVPLTATFEHDLPAMLDAITERTRLIFICSPNNPTGTVIGSLELDAFLDRVPPDVCVVLDEAYIEFNNDPGIALGLPHQATRSNVVVLRTFSKAYGLAGLRVGYAIAQQPIITALKKTALPFGVSTVAQAAAIASLDDDIELLARVEALVAERDRVIARLREAGVATTDSQANFIWLGLGERTEEFAAVCDAAGLTIRQFPGEGARVTIAEPAANDRLIELAKAFCPS